MEEVVIIPKELFERMRMRLSIMSDGYAHRIMLDLEECFKKTLEVEKVKENSNEIQFVDSIAFEIGEG